MLYIRLGDGQMSPYYLQRRVTQHPLQREDTRLIPEELDGSFMHPLSRLVTPIIDPIAAISAADRRALALGFAGGPVADLALHLVAMVGAPHGCSAG